MADGSFGDGWKVGGGWWDCGIGLNGIVGWMGHIGGAAQNAFHNVHPSKNITNRPLPFSSIRFHLIIYGNKKNHHKMPKDQYMCQLCSNQSVFFLSFFLPKKVDSFKCFFSYIISSGHYNQPKKGHKQNCPNRNCTWDFSLFCFYSCFSIQFPHSNICVHIFHFISSKGANFVRWMWNGVFWTKLNVNGGLTKMGRKG
jgi:hypothetical protein